MDAPDKEVRACGFLKCVSSLANAQFERNISFEFRPRPQVLWRQREDREFALLPLCCLDTLRSLRASASSDPSRWKCSSRDRPRIERSPHLVVKSGLGADRRPRCPKESRRAKQRPAAIVRGRRAKTLDSSRAHLPHSRINGIEHHGKTAGRICCGIDSAEFPVREG